MGKMYNLCVPRPKKDGGTWWQTIGVQFEKDDGTPGDLILNCLPIGEVIDNNGDIFPFDGKIKVFPKDNDAGGGSKRRPTRRRNEGVSNNSADDDEIPF